jgi:hypothetical protein
LADSCRLAIVPFHSPFEEAMRAETESVVNDIKESLALLRRHL